MAASFWHPPTGRTIANHQAREIIYAQGDPADSVFYIEEGKVKSTVLSAQGKEAVIAHQGAGDFFGEGCLTGQAEAKPGATT
jgi:CRP/FNR family cyclic AMP-dependent transcriptional regulator